ncbi:MAG: diguanylate cyclase [Bacillus sp. (in: firmicutes)]
MVYIARTQREALGFVLLVTILSISTNDFAKWLLYFQIIFSLVIFGSLFIKYKFEINEDYLTYQILFLKWPIYKTRISPHQTIQITFKRISWYTKGAIIQVKKGVNIRIVNFAPNNIFIDLIDFANKNGISYSKTKDYCILEK